MNANQMLVKRVPVKTLRTGDVIFYETMVCRICKIDCMSLGRYVINYASSIGNHTVDIAGIHLVDKLMPTTYRMKIIDIIKHDYYRHKSCRVERNGERFVVDMPRDRHQIPEMFKCGELAELTINHYHDSYYEIVNVPRILMKKYYLFINLFTFIPTGNVWCLS